MGQVNLTGSIPIQVLFNNLLQRDPSVRGFYSNDNRPGC